jgi:hypothetical protein
MSKANGIAMQRRYLRAESAKYTRAFVEIPRETWPDMTRGVTVAPTRAWRSRDFLAQLYHEPSGGVRLTISTTEMLPSGEWREGLTWDVLQAIKREVGFGDRWAVEVFPPEAEVVNVANMRHLWLLDAAPTYGWQHIPQSAVPTPSLTLPPSEPRPND